MDFAGAQARENPGFAYPKTAIHVYFTVCSHIKKTAFLAEKEGFSRKAGTNLPEKQAPRGDRGVCWISYGKLHKRGSSVLPLKTLAYTPLYMIE